MSEKTPSSPLWPASSEVHGLSKYPYASSTLIGECDAAPSPLSPRQELGDEGWVKELEGGKGEREVHELGREEREVYELAAVRTPRVASQRGSCGDEVVVGGKMGGMKGVRGRLSEALSPKTRSRNGSRGGLGEARSRRVSGDAAGEGKMGSRKGSRKGSRDELGAVARPKTRVQRVDKRTMW